MDPILVIVGPTGVGKTRLSIALAKRYGGEIISADAMQFYRGLDIGTAKVTVAERENIPHHLIDILPPEAAFSVAEYQKMVRDQIAELRARNVVPILVGGSGLYVQAVLYDYRFDGEKRTGDPLKKYDALTNAELHAVLKTIDPDAAEKTHPNNRTRVLRRLELAESADTLHLREGKQPFYQDFRLIGLDLPRTQLYGRIEERLAKMMEAGLLEEVKQLHEKSIRGQSVKAIGYKELYRYLEGETTLAEALDAIRQNSRRYAKRQLTWFRNQMHAQWFTADLADFGSTVTAVETYLDPLMTKKMPSR